MGGPTSSKSGPHVSPIIIKDELDPNRSLASLDFPCKEPNPKRSLLSNNIDAGLELQYFSVFEMSAENQPLTTTSRQYYVILYLVRSTNSLNLPPSLLVKGSMNELNVTL